MFFCGNEVLTYLDGKNPYISKGKCVFCSDSRFIRVSVSITNWKSHFLLAQDIFDFLFNYNFLDLEWKKNAKYGF